MAAERSLDLTIEALGRQQVEVELQIYRSALRRRPGRRKVLHKFFTRSDKGKCQPGAKEECYSRGMGCGFRRVDEALTSGRMILSALLENI